MVKKNVVVTMEPNQYQWLKDNHINISSFFRAQTNKLIEKIDGAEIDGNRKESSF